MYCQRIRTPTGVWQIEASDTGVTAITNRLSALPELPNEYTHAAALQMREYFDGQRRRFDLQLDLSGTSFQRQVWNMLLEIPFGSSVPYSMIAQRMGKPTAVRAVAQAIGRNPCLVVIPCHRVLGKDGSLTGFSAGLEVKRNLLRLEHIKWTENR